MTINQINHLRVAVETHLTNHNIPLALSNALALDTEINGLSADNKAYYPAELKDAFNKIQKVNELVSHQLNLITELDLTETNSNQNTTSNATYKLHQLTQQIGQQIGPVENITEANHPQLANVVKKINILTEILPKNPIVNNTGNGKWETLKTIVSQNKIATAGTIVGGLLVCTGYGEILGLGCSAVLSGLGIQKYTNSQQSTSLIGEVDQWMQENSSRGIKNNLQYYTNRSATTKEEHRIAKNRIIDFIKNESQTTLDLSGLNLKNLPNIFNYPRIAGRLTELNLSGNPDLSKLPDMQNLIETSLEILDIRDNPNLKELPNTHFARSSTLQQIKCDANVRHQLSGMVKYLLESQQRNSASINANTHLINYQIKDALNNRANSRYQKIDFISLVDKMTICSNYKVNGKDLTKEEFAFNVLKTFLKKCVNKVALGPEGQKIFDDFIKHHQNSPTNMTLDLSRYDSELAKDIIILLTDQLINDESYGVLDFSDLNITSPLPPAIECLLENKNLQDTITKVNFSNNTLTEIHKALANFKKLQSINLQNNQIVELVEINPNNTETLHLPNTVKEFNVSNNKLVRLSNELIKLNQLKILNVADNNITELPVNIDPNNTKTLHLPNTVTELNVSNNQITVLPNALVQLPLLQTLNLANNDLTDVQANLIQEPGRGDFPFNYLTELDLSGNRDLINQDNIPSNALQQLATARSHANLSPLNLTLPLEFNPCTPQVVQDGVHHLPLPLLAPINLSVNPLIQNACTVAHTKEINRKIQFFINNKSETSLDLSDLNLTDAEMDNMLQHPSIRLRLRNLNVSTNPNLSTLPANIRLLSSNCTVDIRNTGITDNIKTRLVEEATILGGPTITSDHVAEPYQSSLTDARDLTFNLLPILGIPDGIVVTNRYQYNIDQAKPYDKLMNNSQALAEDYITTNIAELETAAGIKNAGKHEWIAQLPIPLKETLTYWLSYVKKLSYQVSKPKTFANNILSLLQEASKYSDFYDAFFIEINKSLGEENKCHHLVHISNSFDATMLSIINLNEKMQVQQNTVHANMSLDAITKLEQELKNQWTLEMFEKYSDTKMDRKHQIYEYYKRHPRNSLYPDLEPHSERYSQHFQLLQLSQKMMPISDTSKDYLSVHQVNNTDWQDYHMVNLVHRTFEYEDVVNIVSSLAADSVDSANQLANLRLPADKCVAITDKPFTVGDQFNNFLLKQPAWKNLLKIKKPNAGVEVSYTNFINAENSVIVANNSGNNNNAVFNNTTLQQTRQVLLDLTNQVRLGQ